MSLGDLQACPWCAFVGTPRLFDLHIGTHEQADEQRCQDEDILYEIKHERVRQDYKWGEQNHPNGTGGEWTGALVPFLWKEDRAAHIAQLAKAQCDRKAEHGKLTWADIALEEIAEAFAEKDEALLRAELLQSAAVLVAWIGAIDRRRSKEKDQYDLDQKERERPNPRLM